MKVEGHSAIVTGGGSGLGEAVARELARLGAKVAVLDVNADNAHRVAAEIGGRGFGADITDSASLGAALDAAEAAQGTARIVMNIAGIGSAKRAIGKDGQPAPLEDFERVVRVNLIGTYNVVRLTAARIAKLASLTGELKGRRARLHQGARPRGGSQGRDGEHHLARLRRHEDGDGDSEGRAGQQDPAADSGGAPRQA